MPGQSDTQRISGTLDSRWQAGLSTRLPQHQAQGDTTQKSHCPCYSGQRQPHLQPESVSSRDREGVAGAQDQPPRHWVMEPGGPSLSSCCPEVSPAGPRARNGSPDPRPPAALLLRPTQAPGVTSAGEAGGCRAPAHGGTAPRAGGSASRTHYGAVDRVQVVGDRLPRPRH